MNQKDTTSPDYLAGFAEGKARGKESTREDFAPFPGAYAIVSYADLQHLPPLFMYEVRMALPALAHPFETKEPVEGLMRDVNKAVAAMKREGR